MNEIDALREVARKRGAQLKLPYAGAVTPREAHDLMRLGAKLVDVRTRAELDWVGRVPGSVWVEWNSYPGARLNPDFIAQLAGATDKADALLFLCRSGNRSHEAAVAAAQAGWRECYNVLEGFEGDRDPNKHRSVMNGWKVAGLPWTQS
jgi:rhodanese-related sulfurtransferase